MKFERVNLIDKIDVDFTNRLQVTSDSPALLLERFLGYVGECPHIICLHFTFGVTGSFVGVLPNSALHVISKVVAVGGVMQPNVMGIMAAKIPNNNDKILLLLFHNAEV